MAESELIEKLRTQIKYLREMFRTLESAVAEITHRPLPKPPDFVFEDLH